MALRGAFYYLPLELGIGHSIFVPSLKHKDTFEEVHRCYAPEGYKMVWEERIEAGVLGIRVWRVP